MDRIPDALKTLAKSPLPWVDRSTVETLLGVRRRRAQQILAELVTEKRGRVAVVEKAALIEHLRRLAAGEAAFYEQRRRQRLRELLEEDRRRWLAVPPVLVEPAPAVREKNFAGLPSGIELSPGRIIVTFTTPDEGLEKLLALALVSARTGRHLRRGSAELRNLSVLTLFCFLLEQFDG